MKGDGGLDQPGNAGVVQSGHILDTFLKVNPIGIFEELSMGSEIGRNKE